MQSSSFSCNAFITNLFSRIILHISARVDVRAGLFNIVNLTQTGKINYKSTLQVLLAKPDDFILYDVTYLLLQLLWRPVSISILFFASPLV